MLYSPWLADRAEEGAGCLRRFPCFAVGANGLRHEKPVRFPARTSIMLRRTIRRFDFTVLEIAGIPMFFNRLPLIGKSPRFQ